MKNDEWVELTKIINEYMNEKKWDIIQALNFVKGVFVKTAVYHNVSEEKFILQCEDMKEIFSKMQAKNYQEIVNCDMDNPLVKKFADALKNFRK
jgi:S-adenosylmethionine synthetase